MLKKSKGKYLINWGLCVYHERPYHWRPESLIQYRAESHGQKKSAIQLQFKTVQW